MGHRLRGRDVLVDDSSLGGALGRRRLFPASFTAREDSRNEGESRGNALGQELQNRYVASDRKGITIIYEGLYHTSVNLTATRQHNEC